MRGRISFQASAAQAVLAAFLLFADATYVFPSNFNSIVYSICNNNDGEQ
jgi:hypothetical protein